MTTDIKFRFLVNIIIYFIIVHFICDHNVVQPIYFPYQELLNVSVTKGV